MRVLFVKCINNAGGHLSLTLNKTYKAITGSQTISGGRLFKVVNDDGRECFYLEERFALLDTSIEVPSKIEPVYSMEYLQREVKTLQSKLDRINKILNE